ncbi:MAG: hypothetical protein KC503_00185 [Myxococcales bacterium]|nr:hypothetical protein [Myxococcales bacterium]
MVVARLALLASFVLLVGACDRIASFVAGDPVDGLIAVRDATIDGTPPTTTREAGSVEAGVAVSDMQAPANCATDEARRDLTGYALGGIAVDPDTAYAYVAGQSVAGELFIYAIDGCSQDLLVIDKAPFKPQGLLPNGYGRRNDVAVTGGPGARRLCIAGGARDDQSKQVLYTMCLPIRVGGGVGDVGSRTPRKYASPVERIDMQASGGQLALLAQGAPATPLVVGFEQPPSFDPGSGYRFAGLAARGGDMLVGYAKGSGATLGHATFAGGCVTFSCAMPKEYPANPALDVGALALTSSHSVWIGSESATGRITAYYGGASGGLSHEPFKVNGEIYAAHAVNDVVHAVGTTDAGSFVVVRFDTQDPANVEDDDWDGTGETGELVGITDLYRQQLLYSGTFDSSTTGVVYRCPLGGCQTFPK